VLLPGRIFVQLAGSSVPDLKQFLAGHEAEWAGIDSNDAGLDLDLDTPADYERMRKLYAESSLPAAGASW
jgi:CTP:molybdopterin cytidylyltransferase MocA